MPATHLRTGHVIGLKPVESKYVQLSLPADLSASAPPPMVDLSTPPLRHDHMRGFHMNAQNRNTGVICITGSGTAPELKTQGFTMLQLVVATVDELESNFSCDLAAVYGASCPSRPGHAEYAIFTRSEQRLRPVDVKELVLGTWGNEPLAEQVAELKALREKARSSFGTTKGIVVDEELAGIGGVSFLIMPDAHHDAEAIERTAAHLRSTRDAVSLRFARLEPYSLVAAA